MEVHNNVLQGIGLLYIIHIWSRMWPAAWTLFSHY